MFYVISYIFFFQAVDGIRDAHYGLEFRRVLFRSRFPEGPVAMPDGSVIVVEIAAGRITRVRPDGTKETVAEPGGGPNGLAIGPDGKLYCCNNGGFGWVEADGLLIPHGTAADYAGGSIPRLDRPEERRVGK